MTGNREQCHRVSPPASKTVPGAPESGTHAAVPDDPWEGHPLRSIDPRAVEEALGLKSGDWTNPVAGVIASVADDIGALIEMSSKDEAVSPEALIRLQARCELAAQLAERRGAR